MRDLIGQLPYLNMDLRGELDLLGSSQTLLLAIAENAEETAAAMNRGMSAVGSLIAYGAPEIEDGTISSDAIEAIGWLFAELGAVTSICLRLSAQCRQARAMREEA
jgi:hypothetical protein